MCAAFSHPHPPAICPRGVVRGFTLIEIMVVIVIIGIMSAIVVPTLFGQPDLARQNTAKANIKIIRNALQLYQLQQGSLPATDEGLAALVQPLPGLSASFPPGGYLDRDALTDPWGNPYVYLAPGTHGPFDLASYGRDGAPGGDGVDADLTNW